MLISFQPKPVVSLFFCSSFFSRFDYSIVSLSFFFISPLSVLKFATFRLKKVLPFTANRREDFHNFRYIFSFLYLLLVHARFFYDHIIAFSLMVRLPSTFPVYLACHLVRYTDGYTNCAHFLFRLLNDPNGKRLMEFK